MASRNTACKEGDAPVDYDLTCWYLNIRRVIELLGAETVSPDLRRISALGEIDDQLRTNVIISALKKRLTDWLHTENPPTLGQLLIEDKLRPGVLFTHYDRYFCKGLSKVTKALQKGNSPVPMAEAYAKLESFRSGQKISFRFHHEHLTQIYHGQSFQNNDGCHPGCRDRYDG